MPFFLPSAKFSSILSFLISNSRLANLLFTSLISGSNLDTVLNNLLSFLFCLLSASSLCLSVSRTDLSNASKGSFACGYFALSCTSACIVWESKPFISSDFSFLASSILSLYLCRNLIKCILYCVLNLSPLSHAARASLLILASLSLDFLAFSLVQRVLLALGILPAGAQTCLPSSVTQTWGSGSPLSTYIFSIFAYISRIAFAGFARSDKSNSRPMLVCIIILGFGFESLVIAFTGVGKAEYNAAAPSPAPTLPAVFINSLRSISSKTWIILSIDSLRSFPVSILHSNDSLAILVAVAYITALASLP